MPKTEIIPCTKEEMDAIINVSMEDDFFYMLFKVARKTGRRLGEYYGNFNKKTKEWEGGVKVKDIDFDRNVMMTRVLKRRRKIEKEAIIDEELCYLMKSYIRRYKLKPSDYIFRKVGYRQIQNRITSYAKKAKIPHKVSFHNFRHFFVTELFKKGWTYDKIAKLTGHSSISTLTTYDHSVASDIKEDALRDIKDL